MESRLFRLVILVAVMSALGFGAHAAYSAHQAKSAEKFTATLFQSWKEWGLKCHDNALPDYQRESACSNAKQTSEFLDNANQEKFEYRARYSFSLKAAFLVPLLAIFLFYSGRWVINGQWRRK